MHYWIALIGALTPALLLMWITWVWLYRQANPGVFWSAVGLGAAVIVGTVLFQTPFLLLVQGSGPPAVFTLVLFFIVLSVLEEIVKFFGFRAGLAFFANRLTGQVGLTVGLAVIVGLTFAAIENALFNLGIAGKIGAVFWPMIFVRAIASVPLHATCGLLMGLSWLRTGDAGMHGVSRWIAVLALPVALHVLFNLIQVIGVGFRMPGTMQIGTGQWIGIAAAAVLVYISAYLTIRGIRRLIQAREQQATHERAGP